MSAYAVNSASSEYSSFSSIREVMLILELNILFSSYDHYHDDINRIAAREREDSEESKEALLHLVIR